MADVAPMMPTARCVGRPQALELVQRALAPFMSLEAIDALCPTAADGLYEPIGYVNRLGAGEPRLRGRGEPERQAHEAELLTDERVAEQERRYRIRQTHRVRTDRLPDRCVLHLSLPVPRSIPGVQEVSMRRCQPARLQDHYLPEAGLLHDVALLVGYGLETPPLELEFEVQSVPGRLLAFCDPDLSPARRVPSGGPALRTRTEAWRQRISELVRSSSPEHWVEAVLDTMESHFHVAFTGPIHDGMLEWLVARGTGDLHTLSLFAVEMLRDLGFAARMHSGQPLLLEQGAPLRYVGSAGYEHRFVCWVHPTTGQRGSFDLSYLQRWPVRNEPSQSPSEIEVVGRRRLRRGVYPLDLIVAGRPAPGRVVDLEGDSSFEMLPPIDTEVAGVRLDGARS